MVQRLHSAKQRLYVLDSSAFIAGAELSHLDAYVTPSVIDELKLGMEQRRIDIMLEGNLKTMIPEKQFQDFVDSAARETGDSGRLSATDLELLAAARQLMHEQPNREIVLLSDDYSIQNLARHLDITCQSIGTDGIRKQWRWRMRCRGCGKYYENEYADRFSAGKTVECEICGHELKKVRARD